MLKWFAGEQIRNVAALSGNIVNASPISDLNPVLMATGARLLVASRDGQSLALCAGRICLEMLCLLLVAASLMQCPPPESLCFAVLRSSGGQREVEIDAAFFRAYRTITLTPAEVIVSVHLPRTTDGQFVEAYKQARRRDDDIAIVNACYNVTLAPTASATGDKVWRVESARLSYGGTAPTTILAPRTAAALVGRAWDADMVAVACQTLAEEVRLAPDTPGGMVEYRQSLVTSLFFKFFLTVAAALDGDSVPRRERR